MSILKIHQHISKIKFELKLCCFAMLLPVVYTKSAKSVKNSRHTGDSANNMRSGKYITFSV